MKSSLQTQIDAFLGDLQHRHARSANTLLAYRSDLAQFSTFVQEHPSADEIEGANFAPAQVETWRNELQQRGNAPATTARKMAALASFTGWLVATGIVNAADAKLLAPQNAPQPTAVAAVQRLPGPELSNRLLSLATHDESAQGVRDRALLAAIALLGMRVGEVAQLNLADVDLSARRLHVVRRSGVSALAFASPVDSALQHYLAEGRPHLLVDPDEVALFLNHRGKRLTRQGIWLIVKRHAEAAGIDAEITPQTLRRVWLQREIDRGLPPKEYAQRAGTSTARSKRDYRRTAARSTTTGATIIVDGNLLP